MANLTPAQAKALYKFKNIKRKQTPEHIQFHELTTDPAPIAEFVEQGRKGDGCLPEIFVGLFFVILLAGLAVFG